MNKSNIYNLESLSGWYSKLKNMKTLKNVILNVTVIGDSISTGYYSAQSLNDCLRSGYVGQLQNILNSISNVGKGCIPPFHTWECFGTWENNTTGYGILSNSKSTFTQGSTASLSFNGIGINLIVLNGPDQGTFNYQIDSDENILHDANSTSYELEKITITGLTEGSHELIVTKTDDELETRIIGAYEVSNTYGIRIHNMSNSGQAMMGIDDEGIETITNPVWETDLTLIALLTNDVGQSGNTYSVYKENMRKLIKSAKDNGSDVLLISPGIEWHAWTYYYVNALKELSFEEDCGYIDFYTDWGGNLTELESNGILYDIYHPTFKGHVLLYDNCLTCLFNPLFDTKFILKTNFLYKELNF